MFLKQLEISGFKSFAKKTTLAFPRGITAIVGPNGSGKSNITDAIRWVLGEQSFKTLRGSKGADLIFHGGKNRRALSRASATLLFADAADDTPLELDEIAIGREVTRKGDSTYLLNERSVRLSDLEAFLARTGIGAGSFRVLSQGMSDMLISLGPEKFREFIEDAAGVKEYQHKKHNSLLKIKSTKENLEKVSALLAELAPRLKHLKQEYNRLNKRDEVEKKLRETASVFFSHKYHVLLENSNAVDKKIKQKKRKHDELKGSLNTLSKSLFSFEEKEESNKEVQSLNKKSHHVAQKEREIERKIARLEGRIEIEQERRNQRIPVTKEYLTTQLSSVITSAKAEAKSEENSIQALQNIISTLKGLLKEVKSGKKQKRSDAPLKKLQEKLKKAKKERDHLQKKRKKLEEKQQKHQKQDLDERKDLVEKEKEYRAKNEELQQLRDSLNKLELEAEKIQFQREQIDKDIHNMDVVTLAEITEMEPPKDIDAEKTEKKMWRLKKKIERIGAIDKTVEEEYKGVQERHDFLQKEHEDLSKTLTSLQEVVEDLDSLIEKQFTTAFQQMNTHFNEYFQLMFGGGEASLRQIKKEDEDKNDNEPEESAIPGVAIEVDVPGKKIKNLGMLSGGERSLVSIALLFALVSVRTPPFLVLDEIDAALDETNSQRFINLVRELAEDTQFIIITHNRQTVQGADALYGVSMSDGVSQLLSLELKEAEAAVAE